MVGGAVRLLDASGRDIIVVETVGVGQTELGIMSVADTVVVVPGARSWGHNPDAQSGHHGDS